MSAPPELPEIVSRAFDVSRKAGYVSFCRNETGRLLATLAATRSGTLAEFGTGTGVGTAWLRSGVPDDARIITAEKDGVLAKAAAEIFEDDDRVEVLEADWSLLHQHGPYSLVFLDAGDPDSVRVDQVIDLLEPGGIGARSGSPTSASPPWRSWSRPTRPRWSPPAAEPGGRPLGHQRDVMVQPRWRRLRT